jgi:hypothetical protein
MRVGAIGIVHGAVMVPKTMDDPSGARTCERRRPRLDHESENQGAGDRPVPEAGSAEQMAAAWEALAAKLRPLTPMLAPELLAAIEAMQAAADAAALGDR